MSSRSIADLHPAFSVKATEFLTAAKKAGLDVLVYCTLRSEQEQAQLFAIGRTTPGKIVTDARPGQSAHNFGLAFDGAPLINGRIAWEDHAHWQIYGRVAQEIGLEWAGSWVHFKELPHIQMPEWRKYVSASQA